MTERYERIMILGLYAGLLAWLVVEQVSAWEILMWFVMSILGGLCWVAIVSVANKLQEERSRS